MTYLMANKILTEKQFVFMRGRSTILQLLKVVDKLSDILDRGGVMDIIYCDFMKAFDAVPRQRLISLLIHYGIEDPILSWIIDFLSNRKQLVDVNGYKSKLFDVISGVPEGSVLGPILFIIFINSLVYKAEMADLFLYADDLKVLKEIGSDEDTEALQDELDLLYDWTRYLLLRFHLDKCEVMHYKMGGKNTNTKDSYNMAERRLKTVQTEKDLGIYFQSNLSFDEHIASKVKTATSLAGLIRRSFTHLDKDMFQTLFTSIVRSHLEYGAPIWNPHSKKLINMIENVQRRASKLIPGLSQLSYQQRLGSLHLPTLQYRRYRVRGGGGGGMIEMFKLSHDYYHKAATRDFIKFGINNAGDVRLGGHRYHVNKEKFKKDVRKFAFKCRVTEQWNHLPMIVVEAPTSNTFKNRVDKLWKDIMYNNEIDLYTLTSRWNTRYEQIEE